MDSQVKDFLTKQLLIDRSVVTYRSLSRQFKIHVNTAKNNLAEFHHAVKGTPEPINATYLLMGEALPARQNVSQSSAMDVGTEETASYDDEPGGEVVPLTRMLLVSENDLEHSKSQFTRIFSEYIYSLSPALLPDAGLICGPSQKVYEADSQLHAEAAALLGRIIGPHVELGKTRRASATTTKAKDQAPAAQNSAPSKAASKTEPLPKEEKETPKQKIQPNKPSLKPRPSGMLDWSKAKVKDQQNESAKEKGEGKTGAKNEASPLASDEEKNPSKKGSAKASPAPAADSDVSKRGTKRKPALPTSDSEEVEKKPEPSSSKKSLPPKKSPLAKSKFTARKSLHLSSSDSEADEKERLHPEPAKSRPVTSKRKSLRLTSSESEAEWPTVNKAPKAKKGIALSDSEDEDDAPLVKRVTKGAGTTTGEAKEKMPAEVNKSLWAMMDIDDDEVIKASSRVSQSEAEEEPEVEEVPPETQPQSEDADMVDDSEPERTKRRPRKKKEKKVVPVGRNGFKKRRVVKSRMKTDEKGYMVTEDYSSYESVDEAEDEPPAKTKGKKNGTAKGRKAADAGEGQLKAPRKSTGKGGQGSLMNFFGKAK